MHSSIHLSILSSRRRIKGYIGFRSRSFGKLAGWLAGFGNIWQQQQ